MLDGQGGIRGIEASTRLSAQPRTRVRARGVETGVREAEHRAKCAETHTQGHKTGTMDVEGCTWSTEPPTGALSLAPGTVTLVRRMLRYVPWVVTFR